MMVSQEVQPGVGGMSPYSAIQKTATIKHSEESSENTEHIGQPTPQQQSLSPDTHGRMIPPQEWLHRRLSIQQAADAKQQAALDALRADMQHQLLAAAGKVSSLEDMLDRMAAQADANRRDAIAAQESAEEARRRQEVEANKAQLELETLQSQVHLLTGHVDKVQ